MVLLLRLVQNCYNNNGEKRSTSKKENNDSVKLPDNPTGH